MGGKVKVRPTTGDISASKQLQIMHESQYQSKKCAISTSTQYWSECGNMGINVSNKNSEKKQVEQRLAVWTSPESEGRKKLVSRRRNFAGRGDLTIDSYHYGAKTNNSDKL